MKSTNSLRWSLRWPTIGIGLTALSAVAVWSMLESRYKRQRLLKQGKIRNLVDLWKDIDGYRIYSRASTSNNPSALPLVLVHGFGISSAYFVPTAERLAAEFSVYAPDLPGHGKSDTPQQALNIHQHADVLIKWMDAIGLRRIALIANSMGCQIAVDAAMRYPERVAKLVLIGPTADPYKRTLINYFKRLITSSSFERLSLIPLLARDYIRMGPLLFNECRAMLQDQVETKLPKLTIPTLIVRGEKDAIVPLRWLQDASYLLGGAPIAVIPGWGHAVHYSAPVELVEAIIPFLQEKHIPYKESSLH